MGELTEWFQDRVRVLRERDPEFESVCIQREMAELERMRDVAREVEAEVERYRKALEHLAQYAADTPMMLATPEDAIEMGLMVATTYGRPEPYATKPVRQDVVPGEGDEYDG